MTLYTNDDRPSYSNDPHPPEPRADVAPVPAWLSEVRDRLALIRGDSPFEDADVAEE